MKVIYEVITATKMTASGWGCTVHATPCIKPQKSFSFCNFPHFKVADPYIFLNRMLAQLHPTDKDQFYKLLNKENVSWRAIGH